MNKQAELFKNINVYNNIYFDYIIGDLSNSQTVNETNLNIKHGILTSISGIEQGGINAKYKEFSTITTEGIISLDHTVLLKNKSYKLTHPITITQHVIAENITVNELKRTPNNIRFNTNLNLKMRSILNLSEPIEDNNLVRKKDLDEIIRDNFLDKFDKYFKRDPEILHYDDPTKKNFIFLDLHKEIQFINIGEPIDDKDAITYNYFINTKLFLDKNSGIDMSIINNVNYLSLNIRQSTTNYSNKLIINNGLYLDTDFSDIGYLKIPSYYGFSMPNKPGIILVKDSILNLNRMELLGYSKDGKEWVDIHNNPVITGLLDYNITPIFQIIDTNDYTEIIISKNVNYKIGENITFLKNRFDEENNSYKIQNIIYKQDNIKLIISKIDDKHKYDFITNNNHIVQITIKEKTIDNYYSIIYR